MIEAQPEVTEAMSAASGTVFRGQITRRSVHLTDFGRAFCQACFPPEQLTGEYGTVDVADVGDVPQPEAGVD